MANNITILRLVFTGIRTDSSPISRQEEADPRRDRDPAVDRPADLAGHEAARQHADPLQKPDDPEEHQNSADTPQGKLHLLSIWKVF